MRDYKKHLSLLPHRWQVIGLVVCAVIVACEIILYTVLKRYVGEDWLQIIEEMLMILYCPFLLVACLSREAAEDEYVTTVRYRALTISVMILIVSCGISEIIGWRFHRYTILWTVPMMKGQGDGFVLWDYPVLSQIAGILGYFRYAPNLELLYIVLLKVLKRVGVGTVYSSLLLPNRYRKTGWWLLGVTLVLVPVTILINKYVNVLCWYGKMLWVVKLYLWVCLILPIVAYTGVFMVCLSREKQEDEFIRHIRVRLLVVFVIAYALLSCLENLHVAGRYLYRVIAQPDIEDNYNYYLYSAISGQLLFWLRWIPGVSVVYALVLKYVMWKNTKESSIE
ncbi:MAG: hypothetical protein J6V75_01650 [Bacteroidaceae bacterium]|nr:hypothetical protein [Bacteroidaceae bacterium]